MHTVNGREYFIVRFIVEFSVFTKCDTCGYLSYQARLKTTSVACNEHIKGFEIYFLTCHRHKRPDIFTFFAG